MKIHGYTGRCEFSDYIEIRDGGSEQSSLIAKLCGNEIPEPIHSTQKHVWMR